MPSTSVHEQTWSRANTQFTEDLERISKAIFPEIDNLDYTRIENFKDRVKTLIPPETAAIYESEVSKAVQSYVDTLNQDVETRKTLYALEDPEEFDHGGLIRTFVENIKRDYRFVSHIMELKRKAGDVAPSASLCITAYAKAREAQTIAHSSASPSELTKKIDETVEAAENAVNSALSAVRTQGPLASFLMCAELEPGWLIGAPTSTAGRLQPIDFHPFDRSEL